MSLIVFNKYFFLLLAKLSKTVYKLSIFTKVSKLNVNICREIVFALISYTSKFIEKLLYVRCLETA